MLNTALYFSLVIVCSFHRLTGGLITWRQTNLRLLYISCESPGEPCLQKPETRTLRKTARRELVLFFFALSESGGGVIAGSVNWDCHSVCLCVIVGWGLGEWFAVI